MQTHTSNALHNDIMKAGGKDRPPMLAPRNYVQWKSRIKRYIDTKPNHELIHYCLQNPPYEYKWTDKALVAEGSTKTTTERIDNDIYFIVDACPNACEMWKAIERLKQGESINVQDLETNLYREFGKFTSRDGESLESYYSRFYKMINELFRNQCDVTNHQVNVQFLLQLQPEWQRSQQAATRNRGKAIVNSPPPIYDQKPTMVAEDDETSKDKEINKLMALISLSFKKIYKPTNNNLQTSSNTSTLVVQQSGIQCYNCKEYGHVARECQKLKRAKDAAYHKKNMLLCKKEEAGFQLNAEQANLRDDTHDKPDDQELEAHYIYMAQIQEVTSDAADNSGPIFDTEPLQKVPNNDNYNVFSIESEHPKKSNSINGTYLIEQDEHNVIIDSLDMSYDREQVDHDDDDDDDLANECDLLASLIEKLKCEIDDNKNRNKLLETSNKALVEKLKGEIEDFENKNKSLELSNNHFKEANNELSKTNQLMFKDLKKFQAELDRYHDVKYASKVEINYSLKSQLETQKTQFLNEIDRLSREYYYADHMNAILGVISSTSVSRPQLKSNQIEDRFMLNNSQGKKLEVEDHRRNVKFSNNKTSVTAFNDSLNAKTSNVNFVCVTCGKWCSKHMTGNLKLLTNFMEKFLGTVKFKNDQIAPILGYGDLIQGPVTIKRDNYVKGLKHNLFSVDQFCDVDLEVAFRKSTCYIRNLKENDLLTGSRGTDLYSITIQDTSSPNLICLMAKATSSQVCLWHHRISHLNFDTINLLSKNDIVIGIPKLKFIKDHLCSSS
nr:integrase, catalytic region, zinc finger, CCHC-type, peptidase aspartic, catalytic [Tanacetum cinerariifolium]